MPKKAQNAELATVVANYQARPALGVAKTRRGGVGHQKLRPDQWPNWLHYEFQWNDTAGQVDVELHVEHRDSGALPGILQGVVDRVGGQYHGAMNFDPNWLYGGCRIVVVVPGGGVDDTTTTMHNLIRDTYDDVSKWVAEHPDGSRPAIPTPPSDTDPTSGIASSSKLLPASLNTILYGPPGTGKTYHTINKALEILDPAMLAPTVDRPAQKRRFDELHAAGRIEFVTFHQSFSYEDFVEGLRAETNDAGTLRYKIEDGIFKRICQRAAASAATPSAGVGVRAEPRLWKISIDGTGPSKTRDYCFAHGEARIGWGDTGDLRTVTIDDLALGTNDKSSLRNFAEDVQPGDVLLCIRSTTAVQAIGVVTGDYRFDLEPPAAVAAPRYQHVLPVVWLVTDLDLSILPLNGNTRLTLKTVYELTRFSWSDLLLALKAAKANIFDAGSVPKAPEPYVLIIDEINRGSISRIFGELITLIETSKRAGQDESLQVKLPYSKNSFTVPDNVYIIGTMNTADRSLAALDNALRRRFRFEEMPPRPDLLDETSVEGINIGGLLRTINQRIEVLFDRDHCLGHSYLLPLRADPSLRKLGEIFATELLPLLQEYFFEDWQKIAWVLNDHRKPPEHQFVRRAKANAAELFGDDVNQVVDRRWELNHPAFSCKESYLGVISAAGHGPAVGPTSAGVP